METNNKTHIPSIGLLIVSICGLMAAWLTAFLFFLVVLFLFIKNPSDLETIQGSFNLVVISFFLSLFLIPSIIMAIYRLAEKPLPRWTLPNPVRWASVGLSFVPLLILAGAAASSNRFLSVFLLPVLQPAAIGLPLFWLLVMGRRNLRTPSGQHDWGLISISMTFTMPFVIFLEGVLIVLLAGAGMMYLNSQNPQIMQNLTSTMNRVINSGADSETIVRIIRPYTMQPVFVYTIFGVIAGIVPLMEELFKPLALWVFAGRPLSPRDGFLGGMICGASFALVESLTALANPGSDTWALLVLGRIGTGVLHTTTCGMVGWGMASAWSERKYRRLAGAYLAAVSLHMLWNASALMTGLGELAQMTPGVSQQINGFIIASPVLMVVLAGMMISIIFKANADFRKMDAAINN